jgi:type IV pilus assembly protein PilA
MKCWKREKGFSLLELLIVVSIILIIAAIAIPNLLRSKISANEASSVGSLRALNSACVAYSATYNVGFPAALSRLGPAKPATSTAADLIDSVLATGTKSGYNFTYTSGAPKNGKISTYTINANPVIVSRTGTRYFFTDQSGVIRYNVKSSATVANSPIS